jgi:hypothetical protein
LDIRFKKIMRFSRRALSSSYLLLAALAARAAPVNPPDPTPTVPIVLLKADGDFDHDTGRAGNRGWELDYKRDRPGYALSGAVSPFLLEPALYRATFTLRRGHYPERGLLRESYGLFRLEIWDLTDNTILIQRELQASDFSGPDVYEKRWIEFSTRGREGHAFEPRVYWIGLANGEIASIAIDRFPTTSNEELAAKAERLGSTLEKDFLENGFVVSRKENGEPDEIGDATTYTGFYLTSLAWKYEATHDDLTYQAMENAIEALHSAIKGTATHPVICRYVDADGAPFPAAPSKDVYTSFFLGYAAAFPHIKNAALRAQMKIDVTRVGNRLLTDGLLIRIGNHPMVSLTPYLTPDEVRFGIHELMRDKKMIHDILKGIRIARRTLSFGELWPGMNDVVNALHRQDEIALYNLVVPTMNGLAGLIVRARDLLQEQYREDLFPKRARNQEFPGKKLAELLSDCLEKFPKGTDGQRFHRISDLRVLASNALISLHIARSALRITNGPQFTEYYRTNLYTQDELLKTALDWYGVEEDLTRLTAGNSSADMARKGYLGLLSLCNLISLEENPYIKERYRTILRRTWRQNQLEDNPLTTAIFAAYGDDPTVDVALVWRDLSLYPEDRRGFGDAYWDRHGEALAKDVGGGTFHDYSREPLPVQFRPKDSFLWQRNGRRLRGDSTNTYPPTDFLFVYWFCRAHGLIPTEPATPVVKR